MYFKQWLSQLFNMQIIIWNKMPLIFKIDLISIKFSKIRGFNPKDVEIIKKLKEMMKNE